MGQRIGRYLRPGRCDGTPVTSSSKSHDQPQGGSSEPFQTLPGTASPASVDGSGQNNVQNQKMTNSINSTNNRTVTDDAPRDEYEDATLVSNETREFDVDTLYSVSVTNSEDILIKEFDVDSVPYCRLENNKETQTYPVHTLNANEGDDIANDFETTNTGVCKIGKLINEANVQIHPVHPINNVVISVNNDGTSHRHRAVFLEPIFKNNRPKLSFRCEDYTGQNNNGQELIGVAGSSRSRSATSNRFVADKLTRKYKPLRELSDHHEQARIGRELAGQTAGNTPPLDVAMNKAQRLRAKSVGMKMKKPKECKAEESATKTGVSDSRMDDTDIINVKTTLQSPNCEVKLNRAHLVRVEAVKKNVEAMEERDRRLNGPLKDAMLMPKIRKHKKTSSVTQIVSRPPPVKGSGVKTTSESMTQQPPLLNRNYRKTTSESTTRLPPLVIKSNRKTSSESIPFHKPTSVKSDAIKSFPDRIVMKLPCIKLKDASKPLKKNALTTPRQVRFADDDPESRSPVNDERSKRIVFIQISTACSFQEKEVAKCKPSILRRIQPSTQENTHLRGRTSKSTQPLGNIKTKTKSAKPKNSALTPVQIPPHIKQNHSSKEVTGAQPKTKSIKHKSKQPAPKSDENEQRTATETSVYKLKYSHRTVKSAEPSSDQISIQTNKMEKVSEHVRPIEHTNTSGSDTDLPSEKAKLEVDGLCLEDKEIVNDKQPEIILIPGPTSESQSPISYEYIDFAQELEDMPPYQGPAKEPKAGCSTDMRQQNVSANDSKTNKHDPTLYTWEDEAVLRRYKELNSETHFRSPRNTVQEAPVNRPRYHTHDDYINMTKLHDEGPAYAFTSRRHTKKLLQFDTAPAFGHCSSNKPSCSCWEHETAQEQCYGIDTSHVKPVEIPSTQDPISESAVPPTRRMPAASATHKYVANALTMLPEEDCGYYPGIASAVKRGEDKMEREIEEFGYVPRRPSKNLKTNGSRFKYSNT